MTTHDFSHSTESTIEDMNSGSPTRSVMTDDSKLCSSKVSKFKYQSQIYSEGDNVMLSDGDSGFYVAKIVKLIPKGGISAYKYWPTIKVQWYYRKKDVLKSTSKYKNYLQNSSIYELFESDHYEIVIIESIIGKCKVSTFESFDEAQVNDKTFFTKLTYSHKTVSFVY